MSRPPLAGLRVLAVSQFGAGPFGTQVLADLGAEVIKIEDPASGGDVSRYVPPWPLEGDSLYFQWTLNREWEPERVADSGHQTLVPSQNFRTADGWIVVFCAKEKFWEALAEAMDLGHLRTAPRFASFTERLRHKEELLAILTERFGERTTGEWLARLRGRVPCAPVNTVREALDDEQVRARGMIVEVDHPDYGVIREVASPIRTDGAVRRPAPAPRLGQHTEEILGDVLRYPPARISALRASGALGDAATPSSPSAT